MRDLKEAGLEPEIRFYPARTETKAFLIERLLIKMYGRKDQKAGPLFNHTDGGEGNTGYRHTPEQRAKRSAMMKGVVHSPEKRAKIASALRGRKHTEAHRAANAAARVGKKRTK